MEKLSELADLVARHCPADGIHPSPLERVVLIRSSRPTLPMPTVYRPALCLVAQGRKQAALGQRVFTYDPARYLIVGVDLPVVGHVVEASPDRPYLCVQFEFDPVALGDLVLELAAREGGAAGRVEGRPAPADDEAGPARLGLDLCEAGSALLDAALRLMRLLDDPAGAPILAPLAERELLYRLLTGPQGANMRQVAGGRGHAARVARAIAWIKRHFAEPFGVDRLAREAGMSPSAFHAHFKAVTAMSPLQYRAQLRLQEARRLMLAESLDAATAGFRVGYESPSQFSREYRRLFGEPPQRDVARMRAAPELATMMA